MANNNFTSMELQALINAANILRANGKLGASIILTEIIEDGMKTFDPDKRIDVSANILKDTLTSTLKKEPSLYEQKVLLEKKIERHTESFEKSGSYICCKNTGTVISGITTDEVNNEIHILLADVIHKSLPDATVIVANGSVQRIDYDRICVWKKDRDAAASAIAAAIMDV